jgi:ribosomal protein S18 acetylase RimI-like enzyme
MSQTQTTGVRVRPARTEDRAFILPLVARLAEFGPPPWRDAAVMTTAEQAVITDALSTPKQDESIFVAEDDDSAPLGFIHLVTGVDYFTREAHGHVSALVVAPWGERRNVGRALITRVKSGLAGAVTLCSRSTSSRATHARSVSTNISATVRTL